MALATIIFNAVCLIGFIKILLLFWKNIRIYQWTPRRFKYAWSIPGPIQIFGIGNILQFVGTSESLWKKLRATARYYPRMFKLWAVNRCGVFIYDPNDIEALLTSNVNLTKGIPYDFIEHWLNTGLLTSTGDKWRRRRKLLTPAFHFNILKQFVPIFESCSQKSVEDLQLEINKNSTFITKYTVEHALDTLCQTTMGIDIDRTSNEVAEYKNAIHSFGSMVLQRSFRPWLHVEDILINTEFWRTLVRNIKILRKFTNKVINNRLATPRMSNSESGKKKLAMLDLLIGEMKNGNIEYDGICEEVDTFMFEGHDTISMALTMILMLIANHPNVQKKILEEQNEIFHGRDNTTASYDDLQEMVYLDCVIKEGMRLYPPVPVIARELTEDLVLKDQLIPASFGVNIMIFDLHRNPSVWPNPNLFDPDRFLPDNSVKRHPFAYIPFSAGPRKCIGFKFAMLEMKSFVAKVVRNYKLEPVDTPKTISLGVDMIIRPMKSVKIKLRKRNEDFKM